MFIYKLLVTYHITNVVYSLSRLRIGVLLDQPNVNVGSRLQMQCACVLVNHNVGSIMKEYGYYIEFDFATAKRNSNLTIQQATKLVYKNNTKAIIGPSCRNLCLSVGYLATYANIPVLSYGCSSALLSGKDKFPTFVRTRPWARLVPECIGNIIVYGRRAMQLLN